jgi:hypothetical protein
MADESKLRRCQAWQRRLLMQGGGPALDFYSELWADLSDHPAREALDRLSAARGEGPVSRYFVTRTLLRDVLHAACGVEYHAERILAGLDQARLEQDALANEDPVAFGWSPDIEEYRLPIPESLAWEYPDLLTWLRSVEDRIDRDDPSKRGIRLGLLPAIGEEELRVDVGRLLLTFKDRVGDERLLTNYGLHAAKLPDPSTPYALLQEDGTILVPIPDPPDEPVYVFDQFTYRQGRDLRSFAAEALTATEELVDGLLDAFARANERVKAARRDSTS